MIVLWPHHFQDFYLLTLPGQKAPFYPSKTSGTLLWSFHWLVLQDERLFHQRDTWQIPISQFSLCSEMTFSIYLTGSQYFKYGKAACILWHCPISLNLLCFVNPYQMLPDHMHTYLYCLVLIVCLLSFECEFCMAESDYIYLLVFRISRHRVDTQ